MIKIAHPPSNEFSRAAVVGVSRFGILARFLTSIVSFEGDALDRSGRFSPLREIRADKRCWLAKAAWNNVAMAGGQVATWGPARLLA